MDIKIVRNYFLQSGIYGEMFNARSGEHICFTLEHAFLKLEVDEEGTRNMVPTPALPAGVYTCRRGQHRLEGMNYSFETFEVTNVPGHTDILIHVGNFNRDSSGCILVGQDIALSPEGPTMVTNSRDTFNKFMELQRDVDEFTLTIS